MSASGPLNARSKTELTDLARRRGIRGTESMTKDALVKALSRAVPATAAAKTKTKPKPAAKPPAKPARGSATGKATGKPVPKAATKPVAKPTPKPAARPVPKAAHKPAAASAAKVTRPASRPAVPVPVPTPRPPVAAKPAVNGSHAAARPAAPANGAPKPALPPIAGKAVPRPLTKSETPTALSARPPARPAGARPPVPSSRDIGKEAAPRPASAPQAKDRIFIAVTDPYWLHVMWDVSPQSVQRAEAALRQDWYGAKLIIRLYDVTSQDTTSTSETPLRDILVEGDGRNWYVNVSQPPRQYRADIGYLCRRGDFFPLAKSNVVTPPKAGTSEPLESGWEKDAKQAERTLARSTGFESAGNPELREYFEEKLKRSLGAPKEIGFGTGATPPGSLKKFFFEIDAKLIVFGRTDPTAHLTLGNDPVSLKSDGTFAMWFSLPDSRQIIPAVATSSDGVEERTIVLAVERNTKYLDPMIHDQMNEV